jgi:muramoyltetrapeptide carboxypeptidase
MIFRPLQPGDRIAVVAPSSPFEEEKFHRARDLVEGSGFHVSPGKHVHKKRGYLVGTEAERAEDLMNAISDPTLSAIICIRGGYGSGRLLPWLPFSTLKKTPKIFLGHSDITFLHLAFLSQMEWVTFHGPNLVDLDSVPERWENILRTLTGENNFSWDLNEFQILQSGRATGRLMGGNLTCLTHLIGTPYFPDLTGALLLMEDCNEALYRLDRLLLHLKLAGILERLGGLILGRFQECGDPERIWEMVVEATKHFGFPIIANLPFGHTLENQVVPFGLPFTLDTQEGIFHPVQLPFATALPTKIHAVGH